eukprot:COSAG02_NODE_22282_length_757_cov_2.053191_2_plen_47_part_01
MPKRAQYARFSGESVLFNTPRRLIVHEGARVRGAGRRRQDILLTREL